MDILGFFNRFKEKEDSVYADSKVRIMKLHQDESRLSYVESIYKEAEVYQADVLFVKGTHQIRDQICFYDCSGQEIGKGIIQEITIGTKEDRSKMTEVGEVGTILFDFEEGEERELFSAQYIS